MDILGKPWIPKTEMKVANKALQVTAHKAPNLNADVGIRKMGYSTTNGPSTTVNGKSIDHAATISDRSRA